MTRERNMSAVLAESPTIAEAKGIARSVSARSCRTSAPRPRIGASQQTRFEQQARTLVKTPLRVRHTALRNSAGYLTCMLFVTDVTPPTSPATATALSAASCELTKPLNCTRPRKVSTLISITLRSGSLKIAVLTLPVMTLSSTYSPGACLVSLAVQPIGPRTVNARRKTDSNRVDQRMAGSSRGTSAARCRQREPRWRLRVSTVPLKTQSVGTIAHAGT